VLVRCGWVAGDTVCANERYGWHRTSTRKKMLPLIATTGKLNSIPLMRAIVQGVSVVDENRRLPLKTCQWYAWTASRERSETSATSNTKFPRKHFRDQDDPPYILMSRWLSPDGYSEMRPPEQRNEAFSQTQFYCNRATFTKTSCCFLSLYRLCRSKRAVTICFPLNPRATSNVTPEALNKIAPVARSNVCSHA
jgi:hypothetical protein